MALTNFESKEIHCKVIYCGPTLSGKTESLRSLYKSTSNDIQTGAFELQKDFKVGDVFDFLPLEVGKISEFRFKLHLYAYDFNSQIEFLDMTMLKGMDGLVFVADSSIESMQNNIESLDRIRSLCNQEGIDFSSIPKVFQYNKRDLNNKVSINVLKKYLNPTSAPEFESVASEDKGVKQTLQTLTKQLINQLNS